MTIRLATLLCASAVIFSSCKDAAPDTPAPTSSVDLLVSSQKWDFGSKAYSHTEKILSFGPRPVESAALASTRAYIIAELKKHGWTCIEQPFQTSTPLGKKTFTNVIARYAPDGTSRTWSKPVKGVLAAHIDSKLQTNFLGADDAASCAGAILEIAEYLHKHHPDQAAKMELVFFDGEEALKGGIEYLEQQGQQDGLYGSDHYSKRVASSASRQTAPYPKLPEFGILLDMIGHKDLKIAIPSDTPKKLKQSYEKARTRFELQDSFTYADRFILDDHVPMNLYGIPTIDLIGDFSSSDWWHTEKDNLDIISRNSLATSIQVALSIASDHL